MFSLPGYEYFLGFLLIAAAVPILALVTNLIVAPKGRTGERNLTYESGMETKNKTQRGYKRCH